MLQFRPEETPAEQLDRLEQALQCHAPAPGGGGAAPCRPAQRAAGRALPAAALSPQQQKQKTQEALVAWLRGRGGAPAGAGGVGRPALGRSLDAGVARPAPGPDAHGAAVHPADVSSGVSAALGAPLLSDPAHPEPPDAPAGRGDGPAGDGRQARCRQRWCSRSWPRPMGCPCLWKS